MARLRVMAHTIYDNALEHQGRPARHVERASAAYLGASSLKVEKS